MLITHTYHNIYKIDLEKFVKQLQRSWQLVCLHTVAKKTLTMNQGFRSMAASGKTLVYNVVPQSGFNALNMLETLNMEYLKKLYAYLQIYTCW